MAMKPRGKISRGRASGADENSVRTCLGKYLIDVMKQNVVSALSIAFVKCYEELTDPKVLEKYISMFSRTASELLYQLYNCRRISRYLSEIAGYLDSLSRALSSRFSYVYILNLEFVTRLTINTKSPYLPLEIALAWDPILNVPYIPSSALKGAVRSYFEEHNIVIDGWTPGDIFGDTRSSRIVVFLNAYPTSCRGDSLIEPDVVTPHYSEVEGRIDEASASPVPIVYPTVAPRTIFSTIIAFRGDSRLSSATAYRILEKIMEALTRGIGAKTRLGYGRARIYQR